MLTTLGTILILLIAVLALFYPKKTASILPLFFPLVLIRFNIGSIPFSFFEVLIWSLLLGVLFSERFFLKEKGTWKKIAGLICTYVPLLAISLFLIAGTLSLAFTPQTVLFNTGIQSALWETFETFKTALGIWKGWLIPLWIYVFIVSFYTQLKKDTSFAALHRYAYIASATCVALVGIILQYGVGATTTLDGRLGGIFVSANYMVFYTAPALLLALVYGTKAWMEEQTSHRASLLLGSTVLLVVALLLARSYAAWFSVLAAVGLWLWGVTTVKQKIVLALLSIVLVSGIVYKEKDSEKFQAFTRFTEQSSTSTRVEVYDISLQLLKEHWLTGVGMGSYEALYKTEAVRILGKQPYEWIMLHPHNLYLSWWLFTGLGGFISMLGLIVWTFWKGIKNKAPALFALIYIILHGFVDTPFWKLDAMLIFFLVVLLVWQPVGKEYTK